MDPIKLNNGVRDNYKIKNITEFVDLIRRFQIHNYEEARTKNEYYPYITEQLLRIIETNYVE
jgi:hypothetical protein